MKHLVIVAFLVGPTFAHSQRAPDQDIQFLNRSRLQRVDPQGGILGLPSSQLFDLLEPNYFITSGNFTGGDGEAPFGQRDNQVKFRVALRYRLLGAPRGLLDKLFGGKRSQVHDTGIHFGFKQNSFWNIYSTSAPFLDNNYNPGAFVYLDGVDLFEPRLTNDESYKWYFPSFKFAVEHESNGRDSTASRGWNRVIGTVELGDPRLNKVYSSVSFWGVLRGLSDNPDLKETNGRGEVRLYWQPALRNKNEGLERFGFSIFARVAGKRAIVNTETSIYWNPFYQAKDSWAPTIMAQLFCGTGQFLLDHRRDECAFRTGAAFIK